MSRHHAPPPSFDRSIATHQLQALDAAWVECALGDFTSIARGKRVASSDFLGAAGCRMPTVMLGMGVTGASPACLFGSLLPTGYCDMSLVPDLSTLAPRPGRRGEATVICEPEGHWWSPRYDREVSAAELSPRALLRRVLAPYDEAGLAVLAAPELELFLVHRDETPEGPRLTSARAHPGAAARESACEQYSLERATQFEPFFDALYAACETLGIPLAGHLHEAALSQYEVNFHPGAPLAQADAVFRFKRLTRELAARHGFLASFAPKPFLDQPGTGMHWHFSLQRRAQADGWAPLFASRDGTSSPALAHFIAGLQAHAPAAMALFAPYDMSYDRIQLSDSSPTHASWGEDDRMAALRIPASGPTARRVENRLPGGDANPYLVVAATLAFGWAGLQAGTQPLNGQPDSTLLARSLPEALDALDRSTAARQAFGDPLVDLYLALKRQEHAERGALPNPRAGWDLHHLIELA